MSSCIEGGEMNKLLEPTKEMVEAGNTVYDNLSMAEFLNVSKHVYKAMLSKSETIPKLLAVLEIAKGINEGSSGISELYGLDEALKNLEK